MLSPFAPSSLPLHLSDSEYVYKPAITRTNDNIPFWNEPQSLSNHCMKAHQVKKELESSSEDDSEVEQRHKS